MDCSKRSVLQETSRVVLEPNLTVRAQCRDLEGSVGAGQSHLLLAADAAIDHDFDFFDHPLLSAEKMRQSLLVKMQIKAHSPIPKHLDQQTLDVQTVAGRLVPVRFENRERRSVLTGQCRVNEFVLDQLGSQIDQLAVRQLRQQQVVQQL